MRIPCPLVGELTHPCKYLIRNGYQFLLVSCPGAQVVTVDLYCEQHDHDKVAKRDLRRGLRSTTAMVAEPDAKWVYEWR